MLGGQQLRNMLYRECGEWYKMSKKKQILHGYEDIWTTGISEKGRTISFGQGINCSNQCLLTWPYWFLLVSQQNRFQINFDMFIMSGNGRLIQKMSLFFLRLLILFKYWLAFSITLSLSSFTLQIMSHFRIVYGSINYN